jgi:hypothetical protein
LCGGGCNRKGRRRRGREGEEEEFLKKEKGKKGKKKLGRGDGSGESRTLAAIVGSSNSFLNLRDLGMSRGSCALEEAWDKKGQGVQSGPPFLLLLFFQISELRVQVQHEYKPTNIFIYYYYFHPFEGFHPNFGFKKPFI